MSVLHTSIFSAGGLDAVSQGKTGILSSHAVLFTEGGFWK